MAAAATLLAVLALPPVRHAMLSTMSGHMLVQLPLLIAAGWALAEGMSERWCDALNRWNAHGLTGLVWTALALALAMIPRVLDLALVDDRVEVAKWLLMLGCGVSLRLSWRPAGLLVQGFFLGNVLPMMVVAGNLYESSPVRVCNAYLLDDQVRLGQQLVWLAAVLGIGWFAVLIRRFMRDSAATALHGDT
jgi:hypothetical protein